MSTVTLLALAALCAPAVQDEEGPGLEELISQLQALEAFSSELHFETGTVDIARGVAAIDLPEGWACLQAKDARRVAEELWGNPPDSDVLGFLDPPSDDGLRLTAGYGILLMFNEEGFVEDDDAAGMDYASLLRDMQVGARESNAARTEAGYDTVEIVGWAEPPHYDAMTKKLYWAKELKFGGAPEHVLNYDVRILGRKGFLTLQAVSSIEQLEMVDEGMKAILGRVEFKPGHRYSDFDSNIDKVAAVGIGGLIAGKVLAKAGLFAVIAKFGKFIVLGVIAALVGLRRVFTGGGHQPAAAAATPAQDTTTDRGTS
jgi:uncharacterized membrane-anchored protein